MKKIDRIYRAGYAVIVEACGGEAQMTIITVLRQNSETWLMISTTTVLGVVTIVCDGLCPTVDLIYAVRSRFRAWVGGWDQKGWDALWTCLHEFKGGQPLGVVEVRTLTTEYLEGLVDLCNEEIGRREELTGDRQNGVTECRDRTAIA